MKKWIAIVGINLALMMLWLYPVPQPQAQQSAPYIMGKSVKLGWEVAVQGSQGTLKLGQETWPIEFIWKSPNLLNGFLYTVYFLGRKAENFVFAGFDVDEAGSFFYGFVYDYRASILKLDTFKGSYRIIGIQEAPTVLKGYVPKGWIPNYEGQNFRISSAYSDVKPERGTIKHDKLHIDVYPVLNLIVRPPHWSEFWAIGVDSNTVHTYLVIFYSNTDYAIVVDLWNGVVEVPPLGQAVIKGDRVSIPRQVLLNPP